MVYLNGYWNMNLNAWITNGAYDVPPGATIGTTTVQALADYPYFRKFEAVLSNTVAKTWTWGKEILGPDPAAFPDGSTDPNAKDMILQVGTLTNLQGTFPNETAMSDTKMAWVWVTNPDGKPGVGEQVDWTIEQASGSGVNIPDSISGSISNYNALTVATTVTNGFLTGTNGVVTNPSKTMGKSWTKLPSASEKALFAKFWPTLDASKYAVAAVEVRCSTFSLIDLQISVHEGILGVISRDTTLDFSSADPADDEPIIYDANQDGIVNMGDVTTVERQILGLAPPTSEITHFMPLDMGAVVRIERKILGK